MANLLTSRLLAAIDWDEYQRYGRELPPSTVDWIEANGKPNVKFEFLVLQKAVERSERVQRSKLVSEPFRIDVCTSKSELS